MATQKRYKLPFIISLDKKYNEINIDSFITEWKETKSHRKNRPIMVENSLHIEISKFQTFDVSRSEIIDLGMRYALGKQEFRRLAAEVIELKSNNKKNG